MTKKIESRMSIASCKRRIANDFRRVADKNFALQESLRKQGKKVPEEIIEEYYAARLGETKYRDEEKRYDFASRCFGDWVCTSPSPKSQMQEDDEVTEKI